MVRLVLLFAAVIIEYVYGGPTLPPLPMKGEHAVYYVAAHFVYYTQLCIGVIMYRQRNTLRDVMVKKTMKNAVKQNGVSSKKCIIA